MKYLSIPSLIKSGKQNKLFRKWFILVLLLAIWIHLIFFLSLAVLNKHPLSFIFPENKQLKMNIVKKEEHMNYVLVDEKALKDEIKIEEKVTALGRVNKQSRGDVINPDLPKLGPSSSDDTALSAFQRGSPLIDSIPMPEIAPTPPPTPKIPKKNPQKKQTDARNEPLKKSVEEPVKSKKQVLPELPEIALEEDNKGLFPKYIKAEKPVKDKKIDKFEVPGINSEDPISKLNKEENEIQPQQKFKPIITAQKPRRKIPTRKIQVRKIGSQNNKSGGKMKKRLNTTAVISGSRSIAVLRDRYGLYMDKILRRIQSAINIQQQINPMALHEGIVVMSFTINPQGILDEINFIGSKPDNNSSEISAARTVLQDVQNGDPFEPPSSQMLNDPNFQKIVINFVFENR